MGKLQVKEMLKQSGNDNLFSEDNYKSAKTILSGMKRRNFMLKNLIKNSSDKAIADKYIHDLIVERNRGNKKYLTQ